MKFVVFLNHHNMIALLATMASVDFLKQYDPDHSMTMLEKDETGESVMFHLFYQLT